MRSVLGILLGVCAAQVVFVGRAEADQGLGVLTGTVTNASTGEPVEGVVVVAVSNSLQGESTFTTDASGHFRLPNLPPGSYRLEVLGNGYNPYSREGIQLRADATIRVNPKLVSAGGEVRDIEVAAPTVDVGSSSTGVNLGQDFSKRVPIVNPGSRGSAQRSFEGVATATPGARADAYGTSISGTTSPENQYLVDGVSVGHAGFGTNGLALSSEFVEDVNIISGGYMPEYGRAAGGILSAVTKSGSNEFHGGVWGYYSPGSLEGPRKIVEREGSTLIGETQLQMMGDIGFDVGGPLIKDKLWFYAGFDAAKTRYDTERSWNRLVTNDNGEVQYDDNGFAIRERIAGSEETFKAVATEYQALAKLTYRAAENHRVTVSGTFAPRRSGGDGQFGIDTLSGGPDTGINGEFEAMAFTRHGYAATGTVKWNATSKDKKWTFDTTLGWNKLRTTRLPVDGSMPGDTSGLAAQASVGWRIDRTLTDIYAMPAGADESQCDPVAGEDEDGNATSTIVCPMAFGFTTGGPGWIYDRSGSTYSAGHTIGRSFNAAGHHVVKFGIDGNYVDYTTRRGYTGGGSFAERGLSADGVTPLWSTQRQYGFLVEPDQVQRIDSLNRTTTSFTVGGFVQDSWNIVDTVTLNVGGRYDLQNVYKSDGSLFISLPNQISPRVGFIYDWTKEGRSKVFANYGRFFQNVPLGIVDRGGSGEPQIFAYYACDNPGDDVGECFDNPQPIGWSGSDAPSPNAAMFGAGSLPVDPNLKPPSSDEIVAGLEYEIFPRARLGASYSKRWINRVIEDMSRDEATTYFLGNPGEGIATDFPKATRDYDAVNVYLQRAFHKNWQLMASYTLSWLRGNIAGLYRPSTGQLDPFVNSDFDLISLLPNRTGPLPGDNRHVVKVFGAGEIPLPGNAFITVGGAGNAASGGPTNYFGAHDMYGANEVFLLEQGSGPRLPWVFSVDLNAGFGYSLSDDVRVRALVDVFNVANFQAITGQDSAYTFDPVEPIVGSTDPADLDGLLSLNLDGDGNPIPAVVNPNFGKPTAYQTPRQVRFGLRFEF